MKTGEFDVSLTFLDYNLVSQTAAKGVLEPASAYQVGVLNGAAVILGLLGGRDPREFKARPETTRAFQLWQWAQARGVNLLALNLQYCLRDARIASTLVGAANPEQVEADVAAAFEPIPEKTWRALRDEMRLPLPPG